MREIKFRAWTGEEMVILPMAGLGYFDFEGSYALSFSVDGYDGFWAHENYSGPSKKAKTFPIMQYTGLKDKNSKEIYEGDIVRVDEKVMLVQMLEGCWRTKYGDFTNYRLCGWVAGSLSVIGNIYETPELLKTS